MIPPTVRIAGAVTAVLALVKVATVAPGHYLAAALWTVTFLWGGLVTLGLIREWLDDEETT